MATLNTEDINSGTKIVRGSIGTVSGVSTSITWFDLSNPGAGFPFNQRGGGANIIGCSIEGTFNLTVQVLLSLQDTTPASTPAGASTLAVPILGTVTGTA